MADNAFIPEKPSDVPAVKTSDLVEVKTSERFPEVFTLAKNDQPGESGLEAFQTDLFEEPEIIGDGATPFFVVVALIVLVATSPPTARNAIGRCAEIFVVVIRHRVSHYCHFAPYS
jgi:hypothetical protein